MTRTKLVDNNEISISMLSIGRFIITLPPGLAIETFINATSLSLWDAGFTFQSWSPLDGAILKVPEYKVLLMLEGTPPHLHKDAIIARAVSTFGIYLGSVKQPDSEEHNLSLYTVAVAVDRLERVPIELEINVGGCATVLTVHTKNWLRSPLYSAEDLPKPQMKFAKPQRQTHPQQEEEGEIIHVSRRVLHDLCKGIDPALLPATIQRILNGNTDSREITIAQSEEMVSLMNLGDTPVSQPNNEAGQSMHAETFSKEITPLVTEVVPQNMEKENNTRIPPQRIQPASPIQILRRSPPNILEPTSEQMRQATCIEQQQHRDQRIRTAPKRQTASLDNSEASKGKNVAIGPKANGAKRAHLADNAGPSTKQKPYLPKPKRGVNMPGKAQPKMGRLVNLQIASKPAPFKHSSRPKQNRQKDQASRTEVNLNPNGFYEVAVQYDLCMDLGKGYGLNKSDISQAIDDDNAQRCVNNLNPVQESESQNQEGPTIDFQSDEDLMSEEELE